ncbi:MAG: hypothetical protein CSA22_03405 [Deltaproteobacteria bacterium]|nr:MAG: hypothetical protein CSA22_03405 [Deltaproteobacteria bacterium]
MKTDSGLTESLEDYLEVIMDLEATHKVARAKDIAERLGIQRGSVTGALKNLESKGLINYERYGFITLTEKGAVTAEKITRRHQILKDFLHNILKVDAAVADQTACRMEHVMDGQSMERLVAFIRYIDTCPRAGKDWLQGFLAHCEDPIPSIEKCRACIDESRTQLDKNSG